ncbi:MAG: TolC family protein [Terrimicrobiaceae bacterium]
MIRKFGIPAAILLAFGACPIRAELALTPDAAARMAADRNPELIAARGLVAEAEGRARTKGRLPNPELETEVAGGQASEGRVSFGLTQRFPVTARLRIERQLSALDVKSAKLEVAEKTLEVASSARIAFYEYAAACEAVRMARRQTEAAATFADSLRSAVADGFCSALDVEQAVLVAETGQVSEESARAGEALASGRLATALGLPADTRFTIGEKFALPGKLPPHRPAGERPDLRRAGNAVDAGAGEVALARASTWEDIGAGIFVEGERFRDEPDGIEPEGLVGIRLNIPLPIWQNGSGQVAEKKAAHGRKTAQLEALRLAVRNQAMTAYRALGIRYRVAERMESRLLPSARKLAADTEAAYRRGETGMEALFRARERLAQAEAAALESLKNYFISHAEWLGTLGESVTTP